MVYTKTKKPERIPIGDGHLPDVSEEELEEIITAIPNCKKIPKELLTLTATLKRKRFGSISGIARDMGRVHTPVYDWLLCVHIYGLDGRIYRTAPGRKRIPYRDACRIILEWISIYPQDYKFESGT